MTLDENTSADVTLGATDVDGDLLTYAVIDGPSNGTLSGIAPDLTYTPNDFYHGADSFTFSANDGTVDSNTATISINVVFVDHAPVADAQHVTTNEDTPVAINLTGSDVDLDPIFFSVVTTPSHGTLAGSAPSLTYTPSSLFNGSDSFTFKTNDGTLDSSVATVSITVNFVNHAPVGSAQTLTDPFNRALPITLAATDIDGDTLTYSNTTPSHGTLSGTAPNLTYTPNMAFAGSDSFTFVANDGTVNSAGATISIAVNQGATMAVVGGYVHACAIVDGGVQCWGANPNGQLGNNSTTDSYVPSPVVGLSSGVTAISAGQYSACALVNGGVQCWGDNTHGELGNNSTTNSLVPVQVSGLTSNVTAISTGNDNNEDHTCAIVNGGAWCWGDNQDGQLGNNSTTNSPVPVQVVGLTSGVQAIYAGSLQTCAIVNGGAWCWGDNATYGGLGNNSTTSSSVPVQVSGLTSGVQAIGTGEFGGCAIVNGGVQCWGESVHGENGNGSGATSKVPVQVTGLTSGATALVVGTTHRCALVNGGIKCWGNNQFGELGNGSTTNSSVPVSVTGLTSGVQNLAIQAGGSTCAISTNGVQCWGRNVRGELGNNAITNSSAPVAVTGLTGGVQAIAAGQSHTCELINGPAGAVQCWGFNQFGQLGDSSTTNSSVPIAVSNLAGAQAIATGDNHTCAITSGAVQCWGFGGDGELGNGGTANVLVPVVVGGVNTGAQFIAAGGDFSCAVINGGAQCWGGNSEGQLGNNATANSTSAVAVTGLATGVEAITAGGAHACAIVNGGAQCWGANDSGQLGNGSTTSSAVPVQVTGLSSGVQAIAAGADFTCAIVSGAAQCWGNNASGQLGESVSTSVLVPTVVNGLGAGVQAIAAGNGHACAVVNNAVQCWGDNSDGELGNNSLLSSPAAVAVTGLSSGVQAITVGGENACALVNNTVRCWGDNNDGQLGNNTVVNSSVPVVVSPAGQNNNPSN